MQAHFSSVTIEGYRGIKKLEIEGLGQVNLITGRNNTGKSSVLEALRILAANGQLEVFSDILRDREEDLTDFDSEKDRHLISKKTPQIGPLFCGYPQLTNPHSPIRLTGKHPGEKDRRVNAEAVLYVDKLNGSRGIVALNDSNLEQYSSGQRQFLLKISSINGGACYYLDQAGNIGSIAGNLVDFHLVKADLPCVYIRPFSNERGTKLGALWDKIALSDVEDMVVELLSKIAPDIVRVSMVAAEGAPERRIAIVRSKRFPQPVPLRSYGDGVVRLFGIILSLVNAKDGLLLIDEFENGLHHSVQFEVWKGLFEIARRLNIQVFATSHSWDAVEAFQEAAKAFESDAALIRLTRKGEDIFPTLFSKEELAIATRDHIEVR